MYSLTSRRSPDSSVRVDHRLHNLPVHPSTDQSQSLGLYFCYYEQKTYRPGIFNVGASFQCAALGGDHSKDSSSEFIIIIPRNNSIDSRNRAAHIIAS